MHSPVNLKHARLVNFVERLLAAYIEEKKLGELHREVVAVRLTPRDVFLPDLCFFTRDQVSRLHPTHAPFAPTLVIEVLSPRTASLDTGPKFAAYERHGVEEYWILDPETLAHRFYWKSGELFEEFAMGEDRVFSRSVAGFWVRRAWLNPDGQAGVSACLKEIGEA
jgi:Uma2 family endonuclease